MPIKWFFIGNFQLILSILLLLMKKLVDIFNENQLSLVVQNVFCTRCT